MNDTVKRPLKVAMFMTNLDDLGVQRVVINLYNYFDRTNVDPTLILWHNEGKVANFLSNLKPVLETDIGLHKPRLFFRLFRYKKIIKELQPDIVLSFVPATNVSMALIRRSIPKQVPIIMCEHAFLSRAFASGEYKGYFRLLYKSIMRGMYNKTCDRLVMTAFAGKQDVIDNWGLNGNKIEIIHNPQDIKELQRRAEADPGHPWLADKEVPVLIGAGRLTGQKGFDKLIAATKIVNQSKSVRLMILGRGELESELRQQVADSGLDHCVQFLGFQTNHLQYIAKANLFVLSSVWEAMPMVVAETMAVGTPIVSFDCPSGPNEMLDGGDCGYLVPDQDVDALANIILEVLDKPDEAKSKARKAREKVASYDVAIIAKKYEAVLQNAWVSKQSAKKAEKPRGNK